jgi:coatomer protein complex subunit alpha (xenin)
MVSASDDQTIRIWNWQSRSCVSVLTGHNHYVMCASFHPKDDLIVSASLDQTVRVWDITGLRKKTVRGAPAAASGGQLASTTSLQELGASNSSASSVVSRVNADLFGGNDAIVKYVLEGHDRGVNWASFHPTLPLVISGADDRQVKLWRMNETKAWEVDTMRGHSNNVSCVVFHPKHELIVSNSEDRSIRVWDISKRLGVQTFRRENDRFWILAAHPHQNLLAAGHDSGMIVFKLERERPAFASHHEKLFYVKDRYLRAHDFISGRDLPTFSLRRAAGHAQGGLCSAPRALEYNIANPSEHNLILFSDHDGGSYELLAFSDDESTSNQGENSDSKRGQALSAVFLARNRFAVLDKNRQILIKDLSNEKRKVVSPPNPSTDFMFFAGTSGRLLLRSDDRIVLFEPQSRRVLAELQASRIKYAIWNQDCSRVALISKHGIIIASRDLEQLCSVTETVRVKSGAWDKRIFLYTTLNHVKYCLANGDTGIIRTLDVPVYITKAHKKQLFCLDREFKNRIIAVDTTEATFKIALEDKNYLEVMNMIKQSKLCGKAIIVYLQEKGFPEVALHFVDDLKTRFKLALACGNIEVAMNTAYEMGDDLCWHRLGTEALRQGNHQVVEMSYQRTKSFERLSFLYLLTGNVEKLRKMLKIAEMRRDIMGRFHNALFLGSAIERVRVLEEAGQLPLAYLTAMSHGMVDETSRLKSLLESTSQLIPDIPRDPQLIQPPTPILRSDNWPLLTIPKSTFCNSYDGDGQNVDIADTANSAGWDADLELDDPIIMDGDDQIELENDDAGGWGDDLEIEDNNPDRNLHDCISLTNTSIISSGFMTPIAGNSLESRWCKNSAHAADHAAAGAFGSSMTYLNRQICVVNFRPLKTRFMLIHAASTTSVPGLPLSLPPRIPLLRNNQNVDSCLPRIAIVMPQLIEVLKTSYRFFQKGNFQAAQDRFDYILLCIPLMIADSRSHANEVKELMEIVREYVTAVRLKHANALESGVRQMELSAYFTHCNLQPAHLALALNLAMTQAYKGGNFITAAAFARRMLDVPDVFSQNKSELQQKAQMVLQKSEQKARNEFKLNYDERNPFEIDCDNLTPVYRGTQLERCSFCKSAYRSHLKGCLCCTCHISLVGVETLGLVTQAQIK